MSLSPIPKVLSTFRLRKVQALLMGGQACILYGAAEFSRDVKLDRRYWAPLRAELEQWRRSRLRD